MKYASTYVTGDRIVEPDTPLNRRLVEAVDRADLDAVRSLLEQGASADVECGWESPPFTSSTAAKVGFECHYEKLVDKVDTHLPIFELFVEHVKNPNAGEDKCPLLIAAVMAQSLKSVKLLVERGADLNLKQHKAFTGKDALAMAVQHGAASVKTMSPIVAYLLEHGADVNAQDDKGHTALMDSAMFGRLDEVQALLAHGADPAIRDNRGNNALWYANLRKEHEVIHVLSECMALNLHEAAQLGKIESIRAALNAGKDVNEPDKNGCTPLILAMKCADPEVTRLLLDNGADVHHAEKTGHTALHLAAKYGNVAAISILLEHGADIDTSVENPQMPGILGTPLTAAVGESRADAVALLLKRGVDLQKYEQGARALPLAIGAMGNTPNNFTDEPVARRLELEETRRNQQRILDLLIGAGTDARVALFAAVTGGRKAVVERILALGADVNVRGGRGGEAQTALMAAIEQHAMTRLRPGDIEYAESRGIHAEVLRTRERKAIEILNLLLERGADVNLATSDGKTPVMTSVFWSLMPIIKDLLARGANIDAADKYGRTALMTVVPYEIDEVVTLLLEHKADVNLCNILGTAALMMAIDDGSNASYVEMAEMKSKCWGPDSKRRDVKREELPNQDGHPDMVRLLLKHGADVNAVAQDGTTALMLAKKNDFKEVARLLKKAGAK